MSRQVAGSKDVFDLYDFDKTVYRGDCSLDFYLFCLRKNPLLLGYLPYQCWHLLRLLLGLGTRTSFKRYFFVFLRNVGNVAGTVDEFWDGHYKHVRTWYVAADHSKDVIISASPEFLLQPVAKRLGVALLIATRMDPKTGVISGQNCRGQEKVVRLRQAMGNPTIGKAYTDSLSDLPMLALAKEKYIVRGDKVVTLQSYKKTAHFKGLSITDAVD